MSVLATRNEAAILDLKAKGDLDLLVSRMHKELDTLNSESKFLKTAKPDLLKLIKILASNKNVELDDFIHASRSFMEYVQKRSCYPATLDTDVFIAKHAENEDGKPGSQPGKPHYRMLSQVKKHIGRKQSILAIEKMQSNLYVYACEFLGITEPEKLPIDDSRVIGWDKLMVEYC